MKPAEGRALFKKIVFGWLPREPEAFEQSPVSGDLHANAKPRMKGPQRRWVAVVIVVIAVAVSAGLSGILNPAEVSVSGVATSSSATNLATYVIFTSSAGQNYTANVLASVPHGGPFQVWLPNNMAFQVRIYSVTVQGNPQMCSAGILSVHQWVGSGGLNETYSC